ncbi:MAG TPA: hypothetical protein VLF79_02375 [Candidatus Saccharimonadales bacterium]|nr:hypothetical protein [Candidatus Saccharimonadales bacterium]
MHEVHKRRYHRKSLLAVTVFTSVIIVTTLISYDLYRIKHIHTKQSPGVTIVSHIAGPQLFRSNYFQFTDSSKWVLAPSGNTATKTTYFLYEQGLPAHAVTVYLNQTPIQDDLATTHVLPVQIKDNNTFTTSNISVSCGSQYAPTDLKRIRLISISGTTMLCVPDSPQYSAEVGQVGGNYSLALKRTSNLVANYIIIYRNLTIDPNPAPFVRIMQTFQAL